SLPLGQHLDAAAMACDDLHPRAGPEPSLAWLAGVWDASQQLAVIGLGPHEGSNAYSNAELELLMEFADLLGRSMQHQSGPGEMLAPDRGPFLRKIRDELSRIRHLHETSASQSAKGLQGSISPTAQIEALPTLPDSAFERLVEQCLQHAWDF